MNVILTPDSRRKMNEALRRINAKKKPIADQISEGFLDFFELPVGVDKCKCKPNPEL